MMLAKSTGGLKAHFLAFASGFLMMLPATLFVVSWGPSRAPQAALAAPIVADEKASIVPQEQASPSAQRLQDRLAKRGRIVLSGNALDQALAERKALLSKAATVTFADENGILLEPWRVSLADHPEWLRLDATLKQVTYAFDISSIERSLTEGAAPMVPLVRDIALDAASEDDYGVLRATMKGKAIDGYTFDVSLTAHRIAFAIAQGSTVEIPVLHRNATVLDARMNASLTLLSTGISTFAHSDLGRIGNVKKAINERLNGVVIPQGATFSFNETLGGSVDGDKGWFNAYAIFNGGELVKVPGGGICQAATTIYRSVLLAGLPIVDQRNHSLYVSHYEPYGVGLDATVYPGEQDLTFVNNTPGDIVIVAYTVGTKAVVKLYGVNDGRTVALDGPYFASSSRPKEFDKSLAVNEIGWVQRVRFADGHEDVNALISRYKAIPKALAKQYQGATAKASLYVDALQL